MIVKPPMCSLPSANGPSVMSTSPSLGRSTVAVLGACSPPVKTQHAGLLELVAHRVDVAMIFVQDLRRRWRPVGLVDAEQVLLHRGPPGVGALSPLHERRARIDIRSDTSRKRIGPGLQPRAELPSAMMTLPKNVRRLALILGSVLIAGPLVTVLTSAAQAPAQRVAAAPSFVLKARPWAGSG